ncbi:hypothetical protein BDA99DRAFT_509003 [Phascolomyces articulosus]|uniref:Uncharacterized protein n=1 Tax=Phascolomyces articulosus TaxID=60185 RepID=A0AAD5KB14_9FUNG|nr:hypothetical protein BDA99DRAFT_509003 [Phascolomyces articulosus]
MSCQSIEKSALCRFLDNNSAGLKSLSLTLYTKEFVDNDHNMIPLGKMKHLQILHLWIDDSDDYERDVINSKAPFFLAQEFHHLSWA